METIKILIVEDSLATADLITEYMHLLNYSVVGAFSTGEEAVARVGELLPDIILMDINLAGAMDGLVAATKIRKQHDIPSIFLTALYDKKYVQLAKDAMPLGYLIKPFNYEQLTISIEMALDKLTLEHQLKINTNELRKSENKYRTLVETLTEGVVLFDMNFEFLFANQQTELIFEVDRGGLYGKSIYNFCPQFSTEFEKAYLSNHIIKIEFEVKSKKSRATKYLTLSLSDHKDKKGVNVGFVGAITDNTQQIEAQNQIKMMNEHLELEVTQRTIELYNTNQRLEMAMQAANIFWWDYSIKDNTFEISKLVTKFLEAEIRTVESMLQFFTRKVHPTDQAELINVIREAAINGSDKFILDLRMRATTKEWMWFQIHGMIIKKDNQNNALHIAGAIMDINWRKKAEVLVIEQSSQIHTQNEELVQKNKDLLNLNEYLKLISEGLRESEEKYKSIAKNFPGGAIFLLDPDANILLADGMEINKTIIYQDVIEGKNIFDVFEKPIARTIFDNFEKSFEGKNFEFVVEINENYYEVNMVPLLTPSDRIFSVLVLLHNVTVKRKAEQEIMRALEKQTELIEFRSQFISLASHQFRTPLTTINSSIEILKKYSGMVDNDLAGNMNKHYTRIMNEVNRLSLLMQDILTIGRIEAGKIPFRPEFVDMISFCINLISQNFENIDEGREIEFEYQGNVKPIFIDQNLINHAITNLIGNALKYSKGKPNPILKLDFNKNELLISVQDFGMGIPKDSAEFMFSSFFRGSNVTYIQGTGLGLVIVKQFVELHDGKVDYESELNQGSTFYIHLPYINEPA